ncbi:MAG: cation diffusion facilitator family transporter [Gemmatimonadales bacterium]
MTEAASPAVRAARAIRTTQTGLLINTALASIKLVAGVVGNAYVLIADAVESIADIFSSLIVWSGLRIATRDPDHAYPFGYGKAEPLAAAVVALLLLLAAAGISVEAIREIRIPHHTPAPFTLLVLVGVIVVKEVLFRRVLAVSEEVSSTAVQADAWHHRSDAITSVAAFIGISIALIGGPGWEQADDWAALLAACVIVVNAIRLIRPAIQDLMDRSPATALLDEIAAAASGTTDVRAIEKLKVRKVGLSYYVDLHVQADPALSLRDAHILSGRVKSAIRQHVPLVAGVLIHMEPHEL